MPHSSKPVKITDQNKAIIIRTSKMAGVSHIYMNSTLMISIRSTTEKSNAEVPVAAGHSICSMRGLL